MSETTPPPSTPSPAPNTPPPAPPATPPAASTPQAPPPAASTPPATAQAPPANNAPPENKWPEDWRETYAGGDEKKLKALARYDSPAKAFDAILETRTKISKGELKVVAPPPGPDATPEQVAAYRAELGIPETPDKYDTALDGGKVWGEADKPLLESFTKAAHANNLPPAAVKPMLAWYSQMQEQLIEQQAAKDDAAKEANIEALREEWGPEYKKNVAIAREFVNAAPNGIGEKLLNGRLADGTLIANDPTIIQWFNGLQREINPAATVVPGSGGNPMQAIESELASITALMGDHNSKYWKGPEAAKLQARFDVLTAAQAKQAQR